MTTRTAEGGTAGQRRAPGGHELLTQRLPLPGRPLSSDWYPAERISSSAQRTNLGLILDKGGLGVRSSTRPESFVHLST